MCSILLFSLQKPLGDCWLTVAGFGLPKVGKEISVFLFAVLYSTGIKGYESKHT